ncbi:hypothetical protein NEI02_06680 [Brachyspira pilosicoli]|uniref:Uncharacterized protein n=1 Tax=Brachyspira pilosicoli TaxID=52584 RepID=A0AAJ6G6D9_BRAPL|nr:hypothetical protein [Brachyspira pilosicoli]WIH89390.1 hypothetical protein NEI02_06680 [Brachyspira pilosicoli]WIH91684.1 hypothetical protein NEI01_06675 [Brachyspira pilosicoli]WIH93912.1 hypothetical protein NEH99_06350 [Brachyspira pilosicoli]
MYSQISKDTLKELLKIWKAKNIDDLQNKTDNISLISYKFFLLNKEEKEIVYFVIKNYDKEINSIDIAYSLKYTQKQLPMFFNYVDDIKKSGLLYLKMKRRKLNANDDTLNFLPNIRELLETLILKENTKKIENYIDVKYNATTYKKYLKKIISIYENGGIIENTKIKITNDELLDLCKANIVTLYFTKESGNVFIAINNINVLNTIEKSLEENVASSVFIYNHLNILNDIENFIYEVDIQRINIDNINLEVFSNNIDYNTIIDICLKLDLIVIDNKGFISLESDNVKKFLSLDIEKRRETILKQIFKNHLEYQNKILQILEDNENISKTKLLLELKEKNTISPEMYNNILYTMFLFGLVEASFYEGAIVALKSIKDIKNNPKKCFINGNFEITLINHNAFDDDFIYMCNLYFELEKNESVYTYKITEDKILKAKTIINETDSKYSFNNFLSKLKSVLEEYSLTIPKHVESNINRWYERGIISSIYENITLINIKDKDKLEEIVYEANRKGMNIKKINDEYAILKYNSVSKKTLTKFLRQRRIIVTF